MDVFQWFLWCFYGVSMVFLWCFYGVSMVFHGNFMDSMGPKNQPGSLFHLDPRICSVIIAVILQRSLPSTFRRPGMGPRDPYVNGLV